MYKRIDFTQLEGLPLTQDTMQFLQSSYRDALSGIAQLLGDYVIVAGVADQGANWGDGWVAINGELLPFVGGVKASQIVIEQTIVAKQYSDGTSRNAWYTRVAKNGVTGGTPFSSFVRLDTIKQIIANVAAAQSAASAAAGAAAAAQGTANTASNAASNAQNSANSANSNANSRVAKSGDTMTGSLTCAGLNTDNVVLKTKRVSIGDWNMDANLTKSVAHGLSDHNKIVSVEAMIIGDDNISNPMSVSVTDTNLMPSCAVIAWNASNIELIRLNGANGGYFDNANFNATGFNRGFLYITYEV